jgi:hypothetical protein
MLVYGDPQFYASSDQLIPGILDRTRRLDPFSIEEWRLVLIHLGQLEQGLADSQNTPDEITEAISLTDLAANAFVGLFAGDTTKAANLQLQLLHQLSRTKTSATRLTLKAPEGFAFYALFPEQYAVAAHQWALAHGASSDGVLVIGIRSIGTTLSAVVTSVLKSRGFKARRITLRPSGHPWQREVQLERAVLKHVDWVLVVDEGPGLSGSSMAAVAKGLCQRGMSMERIAFFPGHAGDPGPNANEEIREIWARARKCFVPLADVRWNYCTIEQTLAHATTTRMKTGRALEVINLSEGKWRKISFSKRPDWPPVAPQFERLKFLCRGNGEPPVLWKFSGFPLVSSEPRDMAQWMRDEMSQRSERTGFLAPFGISNGFIGVKWQSATPLRSSDFSQPRVPQDLARYVVAARGRPLQKTEARAALNRLRNMLSWNTQFALGGESANKAKVMSEQMAPPIGMPAYGDGRMAPHEWVQTPEGNITKTNGVCHFWDHTLIGRQPIYWDIAGVLIEWHLGKAQRQQFLHALKKQGCSVSAQSLNFYCGAYAAFRMGYCQIAATSAGSVAAQQLSEAARMYRECLLEELAAFPAD